MRNRSCSGVDSLLTRFKGDAAGVSVGGLVMINRTEYGTKYAIIGPLTGLNGRVAEIVTVWIILAGEDAPRFVTAYPKD